MRVRNAIDHRMLDYAAVIARDTRAIPDRQLKGWAEPLS